VIKIAEEKKEEKEPEIEPDIVEKKEEKSTELIDAANAAAERLEKANAELRELTTKKEKQDVEEILSGKAAAGKTEPTEEDKEIAGAKELLKGTGYEDVLDAEKQKV
jgi:hypothetical protein